MVGFVSTALMGAPVAPTLSCASSQVTCGSWGDTQLIQKEHKVLLFHLVTLTFTGGGHSLQSALLEPQQVGAHGLLH